MCLQETLGIIAYSRLQETQRIIADTCLQVTQWITSARERQRITAGAKNFVIWLADLAQRKNRNSQESRWCDKQPTKVL